MTTYPRTCEYLASFGINPNDIPVDGWDREGYETLRCDDKGNAIRRNDHFVRDRHSWPEGFDYSQLLANWAKDVGSYRPHRGYPKADYWQSQTPEFRERVLSMVIDAERAANERERARTARAREALMNIKAAVEMWDWVSERGDVLEYVKQGVGV